MNVFLPCSWAWFQRLASPSEPPPVYRFQVLVSLMLSSQTKDEMTAAAVRRLQEHGLTAEKMAAIPEKELDSLISNVGFHNKKAVYIKQTAKLLLEKYGGDIPDTVEVRACVRLRTIAPQQVVRV